MTLVKGTPFKKVPARAWRIIWTATWSSSYDSTIPLSSRRLAAE
jgi:hypothetical protein